MRVGRRWLMNKHEYLKQPIVAEYTNFVTQLLEGCVDFSHSYYSYGLQKTYKFTSVLDALIQYEWKFHYTDLFTNQKYSGISLADNKSHLAKFRTGLKSSLRKGDYVSCKKWCEMILDWGNVKNGNKDKLKALGPNIIEYLTNCEKLFSSSNLSMTGKYQVIVNGENQNVIMSAGFTKIYSLMLNEFIIYDGRVGAALGLIEKYFYIATNLPQSKLLSFHYGNAKTADNKSSKLNRNPSEGLFKVSVLGSGHIHTRDNLKANWILQHVIHNSRSKFTENSEPLRALECALFMIGYHLPQSNLRQTQQEQGKDIEVRVKNKKMTNHDFLYHHINESPSTLSKTFSYRDLLKLANSAFPYPGITASGKDYASLKLINKYCSIAEGNLHDFKEFKELSDPRESSRLNDIKNNWLFTIE